MNYAGYGAEKLASTNLLDDYLVEQARRAALRWPDERIMEVVSECLEEHTVFDTVMNEALFGRETPHYWSDWPEWAKVTWDRGAQLYLEQNPALCSRQRNRGKSKYDKLASIRDCWDAIAKTNENTKDESRRLIWRDIGRHLGLDARATNHLMRTRYGFHIDGAAQLRRITSGPCVQCTLAVPFKELDENFICGRCR